MSFWSVRRMGPFGKNCVNTCPFLLLLNVCCKIEISNHFLRFFSALICVTWKPICRSSSRSSQRKEIVKRAWPKRSRNRMKSVGRCKERKRNDHISYYVRPWTCSSPFSICLFTCNICVDIKKKKKKMFILSEIVLIDDAVTQKLSSSSAKRKNKKICWWLMDWRFFFS